jgi:hypothetical protein
MMTPEEEEAELMRNAAAECIGAALDACTAPLRPCHDCLVAAIVETIKHEVKMSAESCK